MLRESAGGSDHEVALSWGAFRLVAVIVAFLLGLGAARAHAAESAQPPTLEAVLDAWNKREDRLRSLQVVWRERRWEKKGWYLHPGQSKSFNPNGVTDPPKDLEYDVEASLVVDGDRRRHAYRHSNWDYGPRYDGLKDAVNVFDGKVARRFSPPGCVLPFPDGIISTAWEPRSDLWLTACLLAVRPSWGLSSDRSGLEIAKGDALLDRTPCLVLEVRRKSQLLESYWCESKAPFVVRRRLAFGEEGVIAGQMDITYEYDKRHDTPLPSGWKTTAMKAASPYMLGQCRVGACVVNPPLSDTEFSLEFPVGTRVLDATAPTRTEYIMLEGGRRRPVQAEEWATADRDPKDGSTWGPTYERIRDTPPPGPPRRGLAPPHAAAALVAAVVLVAMLVAGLRLRRRRAARSKQ